jgi:uncharacterized phage protein gp47/JayE
MPFGITPSGFVPKTFEVLREELQNEFRARFGSNINLGPGSVFSHLIDIFALFLAEVWDIAEDTALSHTVAGAEGTWLDEIGLLIGFERLPATPSRIVLTLHGASGTLVPAGSKFVVTGTDKEFETESDVTILPSGDVNVNAVCTKTGPITVDPLSPWTIITPVAGLDSVTNSQAAQPGRDRETDEEFRTRILNVTLALGRSTVESILNHLLLAGASRAIVIENDTDTTDSEGRPPHSIECVVEGGDEDAIAKTIWENKAAGIQTFSTASGTFKIVKTVTDSQGFVHTIEFSRPVQVPIYVWAKITKNAEEEVPADLADQVKKAIVVEGSKFGIGKDVISQRLLGAVAGIKGVARVGMAVQAGSMPSEPGPSDMPSNVVIGGTQVSVFSEANVNLTILP